VATDIARTLEQATQALGRGDHADAYRLYKGLAVQGEALGQHFLGWCYEQGVGIHVDYGETVRWWTLAASAGIKESMFGLGVYFEAGRGVEKNLASAYRWYQAAANAGYREATAKLRDVEAQLTADQLATAQTLQLPNNSLERTRAR
jgi:TPR repeat protein